MHTWTLWQLLSHQPGQIANIVKGTPGWVWGLLAALLALGFSQVRGREVGLRRVAIMPLGMLGLALYGMVSAFGPSGHLGLALALWALAYTVVALGVLRLPAPRGTGYHPAKRQFAVPGSLLPLGLILGIFLTKYAVGVELALQPAQAQHTDFAAIVALLYGGFSGVFAGRGLRLLRLAQAGGSTRLATASAASVGTALALAVGLASAAPEAQAGTGHMELPGLQGDGPVTVLYPTAQANQTVHIGPFALLLAPKAERGAHNGRLMVVSHGSGGSPWVYMEWIEQLVAAGYTVALPEHAGDNWHDFSKVGPESWKLRPHEVSRAIDAIAADARFAAGLDLQRVGLWGMSAGGHTALTLAGGQWSATRLRDHCENHINDDAGSCTGGMIELNGGLFDGIKRGIALAVIRTKLADPTEQRHTDLRIRAIVAGVPFAVDFDRTSLASPTVPLGVVQVEQDRWLPARFHSAPLLAACKSCTLIADLPKAGHGALLGPQPPDAPAWLLRLLASDPAFDRQSLAALHHNTLAFFQQHLFP